MRLGGNTLNMQIIFIVFIILLIYLIIDTHTKAVENNEMLKKLLKLMKSSSKIETPSAAANQTTAASDANDTVPNRSTQAEEASITELNDRNNQD